MALLMFAATYIPATSYTNFDNDDPIVSQATLSLKTQKGTQYPTDPVMITQGYRFYHPALDLDGITGQPIYPIMSGTVEAVQYSRYAYGNAVYIRHSESLTSLYAHLDKIMVVNGQPVTTGDQIGTMGATGRAYGDHLHLEVRENGVPINPLLILP